MLNRRQFALILCLFLISRVGLTLAGVAAMRFFPSSEGPEFTHLLDSGPALDMWYRWDAGFYATIATEGYDWWNERQPSADMSFFPLYPAAVRGVMAASGCGFTPYLSTCATVSGVIISNLALFGACLLLFGLAKRVYDEPTAWRALILLMLSPVNIFLSSLYTEAPFLLLTLGVFYLLETRRFALAVGVALLAALTRPVGIALVPALLWAAWRDAPAPGLARAGRMALALLPGVVFAGYLLFMGNHVGELLGYFRANTTIWGRTPGSPLDAFTVYFSGESVSLFGWELSWLDLIATLAALVAAAWGLRSRRPGWALFALGALLMPIVSGTLVSMPRYAMALFPFTIWLGAWLAAPGSRALSWGKQAVAYGLSVGLLALFVKQFVTWHWIA